MPVRVVKFRFRIIVEPDEGGFHAYCPDLKGLHVDGQSEQAALGNALEAVKAYFESLLKHNDPIPVGVLEEDGIYSILELFGKIVRGILPSRKHSFLEEISLPIAA